MIEFADKYILDFCEWLSEHYPAENVKISILHGFDSIDAGGDGGGFAAYNPETNSILCADPNQMKLSFDLRDEDMIVTAATNIAHEYKHHIQYINGREFSEDDAELFAQIVTEKYFSTR